MGSLGLSGSAGNSRLAAAPDLRDGLVTILHQLPTEHRYLRVCDLSNDRASESSTKSL